MADSGSENIGNIDVSIGADYSPLQAAFSAAQDAAQQAGADIADALVSGAAGAGDIGDEISGQLDQIGPSADDAAGSLEGFAGAAGDAGEASEEGASKLAEMAEQLAAVGEALVITEGLRELGSEALGAADSITRASLALTQITGSGDTAKETIEGLEQLGMADGLSMPSLLSAATRMQAILGPSADVVGELATVANGAAVMGTDIETAATKFDQMATAGTASARTLTSLGISLAGLATALNQVIPGSDATASSVAAMFKALDQSQRVDVLNQALSSLGGTAQTVAEQTFGGQWQQLANAWEGIMVQVGQAIETALKADSYESQNMTQLELAYIANPTRENVEAWVAAHDKFINTRDHTGKSLINRIVTGLVKKYGAPQGQQTAETAPNASKEPSSSGPVRPVVMDQNQAWKEATAQLEKEVSGWENLDHSTRMAQTMGRVRQILSRTR